MISCWKASSNNISKIAKCLLLVLALGLLGCTTTHKQTISPKVVDYQKVVQKKLIKIPKSKIEIPEQLMEPVIMYPKKIKKVSPLLDKKIDISVFKESFKEVLSIFSEATGIDIIYGDDIDAEKKVSMQLKHKTLKEALDKLCSLFDYYYEVDGDTIVIKSLETRYYDLGIPKVISKPEVNIQGDVLSSSSGMAYTGGTGTTSTMTTTSATGVGTGGYSGTSGISGQFNLSFDNMEGEDPYEKIEKDIRTFLSPQGKLVVNKNVGLVIVTDKKKILDKIDKIVQKYKYFYQKQVEVEVTIIEVTYSEDSRKSVDWNLLLPRLVRNAEDLNISLNSGLLTTEGPLVGGVINFQDSYINNRNYLELKQALLNFLKSYGNVEVVSSPSLRLTNGHSALVVVGTIEPFFKRVETEIPETTINQETQYKILTNYEERDFLEGTLLGVVAQIDEENNIYLQITPMLSTIVDVRSSEDGKIVSPVIAMREAVTVLKLHNNDIAILGGLKLKKARNLAKGIPGLMDIKAAGNLFKDSEKSSQTTEIAMIIRARIVY